MFKLLYVVIFLFILREIETKISDKRLCANENCTKPISHAKTILRYHTGAEGVLSFETNADVIVYSKSAGSNMELWGVEIKGVRGYVPKAYLRETRVLVKDPKFMLPTREISPEVPSKETVASSVIEPDTASGFIVVDGTTIYTDPDEGISPTPSSVILSTSTIDGAGVKDDETNDNKLESDINNKETEPLEATNNDVINEKELGDQTAETNKGETNEDVKPTDVNKGHTNENDETAEANKEETNENREVETEPKESLTGQIVQQFINIIGGDNKEDEDVGDEQDDEDLEEDSEEVEDDEDDDEYEDSEDDGYVTDDLDDKSGENIEIGDKIPISQDEPTLNDENPKPEDSGDEGVKLRQLLSEKDKIENTDNEGGTNKVESKEEGASSLENPQKDVEPTPTEENVPETVTDIPVIEPPGFDLPVPKYDQDYVTPNPLENVGKDEQKNSGEIVENTAENLGETTNDSNQNIKEGSEESATVPAEIKSDQTPEFAQKFETEAVQGQALENVEKSEEDTKNNDTNEPNEENAKPEESPIENNDTNVNMETQEEKLPAENQEDTKPIDSQKPLENEELAENQAIIEGEKETKPEDPNLEDRDITLEDIAAENAETMSGIFSGLTNLFGGSPQNKIEESTVQNIETKEDQQIVDVEQQIPENFEANSADPHKTQDAPIGVEDKETKHDQNVDLEQQVGGNVETSSADPQNLDQIVSPEHNLSSTFVGGDTPLIHEDHVSQSPDVVTEVPILEKPPQDALQDQETQDVLQDHNYIEDSLEKEDIQQNEGDTQEDRVLDVQQNEDYVPVPHQKEEEDDTTEATVVEAAPNVKENLGDIGDHVFDVHDQLLSKNSVEYGSCPAGESDCPTDISVVQKQLEMEEIVQAPLYGDFINLLTLLGVTGLSVALFLLGFIKIDKNRQESGLIAKINTLEKALLVASKENALLIDRVTEIQNETAAENDRISSEEYDNLNKTYKEVLTAKSILEEQVQSLEKELENSTEVGLELNRMLSDIISSQNGSEILIANVEQLQRQLVEQQGTINTINDTLNLKDTENHELQLELEIKNKKVTHLQTDLDKMAMNLFKVEEDKEQMQAKLEGEIIELKDQLEKNKNSFNSARTSMLDEINNLKAKYGEIQRNLDVKISEYNILKDNFNQIKTIKNNSEALESLLNASSMKAELQQLQRDNQTLNDVLRQEQQTKFTLEKQIEIALQEAQSYKEKYDEADKEKLEARTKLEVLSNYFKEKEAQLQKELSKHESMWVEQQGEATSTVERIKYMQEELQNCKSQNELLKQEIVAQEVELKSQISVLEKKAHESWVLARQAERRLEDAKQEAAQLRNRLTLKERSYVEDKSQNRMQSPLEQNGDVAISPLHMPVETPASPPLLYGTRDHLTTSPPLPNLPPFLPPPPGVPFMPPPIPGVPGFMPPPPSMFPVDHRPPPLGRMSSPPPPLNSRYSPDSRYSPYDRNSPSPPYDDEYRSSPPPMPMRGYSPFNRDDRRDFKRPPPLRTNGRNKGAMSSGSGNSNESLEKISRHHSKV